MDHPAISTRLPTTLSAIHTLGSRLRVADYQKIKNKKGNSNRLNFFRKTITSDSAVKPIVQTYFSLANHNSDALRLRLGVGNKKSADHFNVGLVRLE